MLDDKRKYAQSDPVMGLCGTNEITKRVKKNSYDKTKVLAGGAVLITIADGLLRLKNINSITNGYHWCFYSTLLKRIMIYCITNNMPN